MFRSLEGQRSLVVPTESFGYQVAEPAKLLFVASESSATMSLLDITPLSRTRCVPLVMELMLQRVPS